MVFLYMLTGVVALNALLRLFLRGPVRRLTKILDRRAADQYESMSCLVGPLHLLVAVLIADQLARWWLRDHEAFEQIARHAETLLVVSAIWLALRAANILTYRLYFRKLNQQIVPLTIKKLVNAALCFLAFMAFLNLRFGYAPGDLIISAAVIGLVLVIAFQNLLANLFNGLLTSLSRTLAAGDVIRVGEFEGTVVESDWMTTTIRPENQTHVLIPNRMISETTVTNYCRPDERYRCEVQVTADSSVPPNRAKKVLAQALDYADGVLEEPAPELVTEELLERQTVYRLRFWVADYTVREQVEDRVRTALWYRLRRHGMETAASLAAPRGDPRRPEPGRTGDGELAACLTEVPLLAALEPQTIERLCQLVEIESYGEGERLFRQGEGGDSMYIVRSGAIDISIDETGLGGQKRERLIHTFGEKGFFGEMSLLTGDPRTAHARAAEDSELVVIRKENFKELILGAPQAAERLSEVVAERNQRLAAEAASGEEIQASEKTSILRSIRSFFEL